MIKLQLLMGIVTFGLWVYSLIDVIGTPDGEVKHIQKLWWLLLVLFFPFVGSVAWLVAGRDRGTPRAFVGGRSSVAYPEYDRPGRATPHDPTKDDDFLRQVRERAEQQRSDHAAKKRMEAEVEKAEEAARKAKARAEREKFDREAEERRRLADEAD